MNNSIYASIVNFYDDVRGYLTRLADKMVEHAEERTIPAPIGNLNNEEVWAALEGISQVARASINSEIRITGCGGGEEANHDQDAELKTDVIGYDVPKEEVGPAPDLATPEEAGGLCNSLEVELSYKAVEISPFNKASAHFGQVDGKDAVVITASTGTKDPGVALMPWQGSWELEDCQTVLSFLAHGKAIGPEAWAGLKVQVYLKGDNPSQPTFESQLAEKVDIDGWILLSVDLDDRPGKEVVKIQPIIVSQQGVEKVDLALAEFVFE